MDSSGSAIPTGGAQSEVRDLCLKLGIGANRIKALRKDFTAEHGKTSEAELARYLRGLWAELGDQPRYPAAGGGSSHVGDETFRWPDHDPDCACGRCGEEHGYTTNPRRAVEQGIESVPPEYQRELSTRARRDFGLVRAEENERRELHNLTTRARDLIKRSPAGTRFDRPLVKMREAVAALEDLQAEAA